MSYPNVLYGPEGEQFNTYAVPARGGRGRWPLGTQLVLQDGRKFRFATAGATTLVIGDINQSAANVADDQGRTGIAAAVGSRAPTLTTGSAVAANEYAEGYFTVSVTPGAGQVYLIDNHLAGTTATAFNLAPGHAIRVALTTPSRCNLFFNPYRNVIQTIATTPPAGVAGVSVSAPTDGLGCWLQRTGVACVLTEATTVTVAGAAFSATTITAGAGGRALHDATNASIYDIGVCIPASAVNAWTTINMDLD